MQDRQQFFKSTDQGRYDKVRENLVLIILEKTLVSAQIYHKVLSQLEKKYNCSLYDCYKHPECLSTILKDQHNNSYKSITRSINQQLDIFADAKSIITFLQAFNH
ncbi:protein of unknown function [Candidatus Nitrosotalea okcheonensis]|uniref:Uncharacterized protein n=1 Tax=Candidatus Nitrosotalea okcheonensis TaxID=1903276 RepID=A0A2H1FFC0_9ARCH|nr:protein of unknown function [Candidatus Nitrosotalea okcheonensis]